MAASRPRRLGMGVATLVLIGTSRMAPAEPAARGEDGTNGPFGVLHVNLAALHDGPWADLVAASRRTSARRGWRARLEIDVTPLETATLFLHRDGPLFQVTGEVPMTEAKGWLERTGFAPAPLGKRQVFRGKEGRLAVVEPDRILSAPPALLTTLSGTSTTHATLNAWLEKEPKGAYAWVEAKPPEDLPGLAAARITPRRITASLTPLGDGARLEAECELDSPKMARRALWWLMQNAVRWESLLPPASLDLLRKDARKLRLKVKGRRLVLGLRLSPASLRALAGVEPT